MPMSRHLTSRGSPASIYTEGTDTCYSAENRSCRTSYHQHHTCYLSAHNKTHCKKDTVDDGSDKTPNRIYYKACFELKIFTSHRDILEAGKMKVWAPNGQGEDRTARIRYQCSHKGPRWGLTVESWSEIANEHRLPDLTIWAIFRHM